MNYDNYLENEREFFESSETPDRVWAIMDIDNQDWKLFNDRHDAEEYYYSLSDLMENVDFGYTYDGRFTSRWSDNVNEFYPVRL